MTAVLDPTEQQEEQQTSRGDRRPPQNLPAEQCVLGAMMLSLEVVGEIAEILTVQDFYRPAHAIVFAAILDLYGRAEPVDAFLVAAQLEETGELHRVGGLPYLHTLISTVPTAANGTYYARRVAEQGLLRRLATAGTKIAELGYQPHGTAEESRDRAEQILFDLPRNESADNLEILADMLQPTLDEIEAIGGRDGQMLGVPTGFTDLDHLLNGLQAGQLIVVAGRPGLGKTTLATDFGRHAAVKCNLASAIFSLEMSKVEIVMRLLSAEARVPLHAIRSGQLSDDDWTKMARCIGEISEAPLFLDDTPNMTLMSIRAKARRLKQRHDLKLIIVDYLQLMTPDRRGENQQREISDLSRGFKLLAKEVECPVIAVSQLNRGPEQRTDHRPQLSDLRGSGSIEQDADVVILLHRDDYYDKESPRAGEADIIVAKHRNGPTDTISVAAQLHVSRFVDMSMDHPR